MANQDLSTAIEMLKNLLGSDAGGKVDEIVETLGLGGAANKNSAPAQSDFTAEPVQEVSAPPAVPAPTNNVPMDLSGLLSGLGSMANVQNNPHMNLLVALKPYMNPMRASKIDSAMKIIQLAQITRGMGLFGK
ncbi:MAG: hypothetical protein HFI90_04405 [Clostridia bacterium]|nr:hypothetical protein [Clostridia bacterium]